MPQLCRVSSSAQLWVTLVESFEALLKEVHLWEEDSWVFLFVDVAVEASEDFPESWCTFLAHLAVEDQNCL